MVENMSILGSPHSLLATAIPVCWSFLLCGQKHEKFLSVELLANGFALVEPLVRRRERLDSLKKIMTG
jgi:hypothetical protein